MTADARPSLHDQWRALDAHFEVPTPSAPATDAIGRTLRHDGWTPERQQVFLRLIAQGVTVQAACAHVGLSTASAYALRARAAGAGFALGWSAANHIARQPLADGLLARALDGQVEWYTRANGERAERFRYDNGLATRMLARLDREAEAEGPAAQAAARMVAGEFEAFLVLLGRDEGPARAALFLAARAKDGDLGTVQALARADRFARAGAGLATEVAVADLDLTARAGWTAEQWQRAEAAGLLRVAPEPEPAPEPASEPQQRQLVSVPVWRDEETDEWRTCFPPPTDFDGEEYGRFGDEDYERDLTEAEEDAVEDAEAADSADERAEAASERDAWFAATAQAVRAHAAAKHARDAEAAPDSAGATPDLPDIEMLETDPPRSAPSRERAGGLG